MHVQIVYAIFYSHGWSGLVANYWNINEKLMANILLCGHIWKIWLYNPKRYDDYLGRYACNANILSVKYVSVYLHASIMWCTPKVILLNKLRTTTLNAWY
jgi:hypothetical protein